MRNSDWKPKPCMVHDLLVDLHVSSKRYCFGESIGRITYEEAKSRTNRCIFYVVLKQCAF